MTVLTEASATVSKVFSRIYEREGVPAADIRLIFGGKQLEPSRMLAEYGVQKGSTLHMILRLSGGDESLSRQRRESDTLRLLSRAHRSEPTMLMTTAYW